MAILLRAVVMSISILLLLPQLARAKKDTSTAAFYNSLVNESPEKLFDKAANYIRNGRNIDSALVCYTVLGNRAGRCKERSEQILCIKAYAQMAYIYYFDYYDYSKAMEYMAKAQDLAEKWNVEVAEVPLYYGLMYGSIAEQTLDPKTSRKAFDYQHQAFDISLRQNDLVNLNLSYCNLISKAYVLNMPDSINSIVARFTDYSTDKDGDRYHLLFNIQLGKGLQLMLKGDYDEAIATYSKILDEIPETRDYSRYRCGANEYIAIAYDKKGDLQNSEKYYLEALRIAETNHLLDAKIELYRLLADLAKSKGNKAAQLEYYTNHLSLKDSLLNYQQIAAIEEVHFLSEMNKAEREIEEMNSRRRNLEGWLIAGGIMLLVIGIAAFYILRQNRDLHRRNESLFQKNEEVMKAEENERRMRNRFQNELEELNERLSATTEELRLAKSEMKPQEMQTSNESSPEQAAPEEAASILNEDCQSKYSNSSLTDNGKEILADKIREFMETNEEIYSKDFSAERMAKLLDEKYKYVSQTINEVFGINFNTLLNNYRIREACRRMATADYEHLTLEGLADSVGIKSRSTFTTQFKRVTGLTPSQYLSAARRTS